MVIKNAAVEIRDDDPFRHDVLNQNGVCFNPPLLEGIHTL